MRIHKLPIKYDNHSQKHGQVKYNRVQNNKTIFLYFVHDFESANFCILCDYSHFLGAQLSFDPQNNWATPFHSVIFCFSGDDASAEDKNVEEDELGKWE